MPALGSYLAKSPSYVKGLTESRDSDRVCRSRWGAVGWWQRCMGGSHYNSCTRVIRLALVPTSDCRAQNRKTEQEVLDGVRFMNGWMWAVRHRRVPTMMESLRLELSGWRPHGVPC